MQTAADECKSSTGEWRSAVYSKLAASYIWQLRRNTERKCHSFQATPNADADADGESD
jgi:hypothetical protein